MIQWWPDGEPLDTELIVQKNGGIVGAVEEVLHIVVGARQVIDFSLQLRVDGGQLLVQRLQLFFRGF